MELEDGYLLQGYLDWRNTELDWAYFNPEYLQVRDATGQSIAIVQAQVDSGIDNPNIEKRMDWTIQTATKSLTGPLTIALLAVTVEQQQLNIPYEIDLGAEPQIGQTWELNQALEVAGRRVTVLNATLEISSVRGHNAYGLSFILQTDPDQFGSISIAAPGNQLSVLSLTGSSDLQGTFVLTLNYDQLGYWGLRLPNGVGKKLAVQQLIFYGREG